MYINVHIYETDEVNYRVELINHQISIGYSPGLSFLHLTFHSSAVCAEYASERPLSSHGIQVDSAVMVQPWELRLR